MYIANPRFRIESRILKKLSITALPMILLLSACGGGGTSTSNPTFVPEDPVAPNDPTVNLGDDGALTAAELNALFTDVNGAFAGTSATPVAELGNTGIARYDGFFAVSSTNDILASLGSMTLNVDLAADKLSGSATNFVGDGGVPLSGSLTLSNGTVTRDAASDRATITLKSSGDLQRAGQRFTYGVVDLAGGFQGDNAGLISATGTTSLTVDGTQTAVNVGIGAQLQP